MKFLFSIALLAASFAAQATGPHDPPTPPATPPGAVAGSYSGITADVRQRAEAQARAAAAAESRSAATGGRATSTGGTAEVTINNAGNNDNFGGRVVIHPSMIPPSPMAMNPQGNLAVVQTGCMPLVATRYEQVYATSPGMFNTDQVPNGQNVVIGGPKIGPTGEIIVFDQQRQSDGSILLIGNMLIVSSAITNQSGGANLAAGFIRSSGSGGQVGGGASAAMQQLTDRVIAMPCIAGIVPPPAMPVSHPVIFECKEPAKKPVLRKRRPMTCPKADRN